LFYVNHYVDQEGYKFSIVPESIEYVKFILGLSKVYEHTSVREETF